MKDEATPEQLAMDAHHRSLWIRTIIATCCGTDRQRQSFCDGYNGFPLSPRASLQMRENHALGQVVLRLLNPSAAHLKEQSNAE